MNDKVKRLHLDTIEDIYQLLRVCHDYDNKKSRRNPLGLDVTSEKLDELKHLNNQIKNKETKWKMKK